MNAKEHYQDEVRRLLAPVWMVTAPRDKRAFVRNLHLLLPEGSRLVVEGTMIPRDAKTFLAANQLPDCPKISLDTIWPSPKVFHLSVTPELMGRLSEFVEVDGRWSLCEHLKAYMAKQEVMAWYDAECGDDWYVDATVTEDKLKYFCSVAGCQYKRCESKK